MSTFEHDQVIATLAARASDQVHAGLKELHAWRGERWLGLPRRGAAGRGTDWRGEAIFAGQGPACFGWARSGVAGPAMACAARLGSAWHGEAISKGDASWK